MSTTLLANPAEMIHCGAPRVIHSDAQLAAYTNALFALTAKKKTTRDENQAIELLTLLIEQYEAQRFPVPSADPTETLRLLMSSHGLKQKDLVPELGAESTVSAVLTGKRQLKREHITRLSRRFHVSPAVFFPDADTAA